MKNTHILRAHIILMTLLMPLSSFAEPMLSIGKILSKDELTQLKSSKIKIDNKTYEIISSSSPSLTYVVNSQGNVGIGENTIAITNILSDQFKSKAQHIIKNSNSVKYYDHIKSITLNFENFSQTMDAYNQLSKLFPESTVNIPIQFTEITLR